MRKKSERGGRTRHTDKPMRLQPVGRPLNTWTWMFSRTTRNNIHDRWLSQKVKQLLPHRSNRLLSVSLTGFYTQANPLTQ